MLDVAQQQFLLRVARESLTHYLDTSQRLDVTEIPEASYSVFQQRFGVFVTLMKNGELRGCIGSIVSDVPLVEGVVTQAVQAGVFDRRFSPVRAGELLEIQFSISVLSPPVSVSGYEDICIGKHGIILKKGAAQALFLPKVPVEQGWDLVTTLSSLAKKAGLDRNAWRHGASFWVFEADEFSE